MLMPKAAVHEYHFLAGREHEIGPAKQIALMQAVTVTHLVNHFAYRHFRGHSLRSNCAHIRATRLARQFVHGVVRYSGGETGVASN